jgi:hypothetical protein
VKAGMILLLSNQRIALSKKWPLHCSIGTDGKGYWTEARGGYLRSSSKLTAPSGLHCKWKSIPLLLENVLKYCIGLTGECCYIDAVQDIIWERDVSQPDQKQASGREIAK